MMIIQWIGRKCLILKRNLFFFCRYSPMWQLFFMNFHIEFHICDLDFLSDACHWPNFVTCHLIHMRWSMGPSPINHHNIPLNILICLIHQSYFQILMHDFFQREMDYRIYLWFSWSQCAGCASRRPPETYLVLLIL